MADLMKIQAEIAPEQTKVSQVLAWLRDVFMVVDQATLDQAGTLVKSAKERWKDLETKRTSITKPLLEAKRGVDQLFKPVLDQYAEAEQVLKAKIGAYAAQREAERAAAMQASAAEYQAGGTPTEMIPEPPKTAGITTRQLWDFTVELPDLVPRELCSPDPDKIKAAIWYADSPHTPPQPIAGVKFFLRDQVTVRTGAPET